MADQSEETQQHMFKDAESMQERGSREAEPEIAVFRPDREGIRKVLGDLEAEIMEYLWEHEKQTSGNKSGVTVREVYEAFRLRRVIAYTTILSTMTRLNKKHFLRVRKEDTAYVYTPVLSEASFIENMVSSILENLLVSFSQTTHSQVKRLMTPPSAQRLAELKETVSNLREAASSQNTHTEHVMRANQPMEGEKTNE